MQLHVAVAGGVLQPVRHGQVGLVPLAGLPAVDPGVVGAGAGVAGLALEVAEPGVHGLPDHVVDLGDQGGPVLRRLRGRLPGGPGGRSRRGRRGRSRSTWTATGSGRRTAGSAGPSGRPRCAARACARRWRAARRPAAARRGRRLSGRWPGACPAGCRRGPCARRTAGHTGSRSTVWPGSKPRALGAGAPPAAGRLSPALAGLDVIAGRVLGRAAVHLLPDVVKVIALAQGRDNRHRLIPRQPGAAELPMIIRWCMGVELERSWETETITGQG